MLNPQDIGKTLRRGYKRGGQQPAKLYGMSTITPLKQWLRAATPADLAALAAAVGTSALYIRHLSAGEDKLYHREPRAALAAAIERETLAMSKASAGRLPVVYRTDLNSTCRQCAFARKCLGEDVTTAGEFRAIV